MKKLILLGFTILLAFTGAQLSFSQNESDPEVTQTTEQNEVPEHEGDTSSTSIAAITDHGVEHHDAHSHMPNGFAVIPFVVLLLMIATGPLFFAHFWHKNYPIVALLLGVGVVAYYIFALGDTGSPIHALAEYVQFIALLAGLFMAAGGILIKVDKEGKPMVNVILLIIGAILANVIGTTGASMLLIRPFIRLNQNRIKAYHVMFFIFMVSNVGGSLTPIGDPPLFLGFLKGVPFVWTITHDFVPWLFAIALLSIIFFIMDSKNKSGDNVEKQVYTGKVTIQGSKNFVWIALVIACVFIDPNVFDFVPGIVTEIHGQVVKISFLREALMLSIACLSYYFADVEALKGNEFEFEPIKEVAFIFIGIFFTMMPALQLVGAFAASPEGKAMIDVHVLYWGTGALSGVLDNAPTYVNFLTAAISAKGGDVSIMSDVKDFAAGEGVFAAQDGGLEARVMLTAISVASVFFGAMTYIGNAPNFMVKSIAEQVGVKMPSFFSYIAKYSLVILLPILFLTWLIFFYFGLIEAIV